MPASSTFLCSGVAFDVTFLSWDATTCFLSPSSTLYYNALAGYPFNKIASTGRVSGVRRGYFVTGTRWPFSRKVQERRRGNLEKAKLDSPHSSQKQDAMCYRLTYTATFKPFPEGRAGFSSVLSPSSMGS